MPLLCPARALLCPALTLDALGGGGKNGIVELPTADDLPGGGGGGRIANGFPPLEKVLSLALFSPDTWRLPLPPILIVIISPSLRLKSLFGSSTTGLAGAFEPLFPAPTAC